MQSHVLVLGLSDGCVVRWALDGSWEPEGESLPFVTYMCVCVCI